MTAAPILDHMAALADPIRCRMLLPLERHELTVNEICAVLQLPQSTVSRHLKTLADDDWVAAVSNMGAPLVGQERLTDSRTIARAVALMEEHIRTRFRGIMSLEIGGGNSIQPLMAAAHLKRPVIDSALSATTVATTPVSTTWYTLMSAPVRSGRLQRRPGRPAQTDNPRWLP